MNRRQLLGGFLVAPAVMVPTLSLPKEVEKKEVNLSLKEALIRLPLNALSGAMRNSEEVMQLVCSEYDNVDKFMDVLSYTGSCIVAAEFGKEKNDEIYKYYANLKYDNKGRRV